MRLIHNRVLLSHKSENFLFAVSLFVSVIITFVNTFYSEATYDSGDGVQHYLIARYAIKHPELFLDLWGKPLFTLLSFPFAQYGLRGMVVFQLMCSVITTIFLFLSIRGLGLRHGWLSPFFIFFAPVYFAVINSGLTEILFCTFFVIALWLLVKKRYWIASLFFSFAPFVRPEANFLIPLFITILVIKRKFIQVTLLSSGYILFSIIGYFFYYHDIFWVFKHNYKFEQFYQQKGSLLHYAINYKVIWGGWFAILLIAGILKLIIFSLKEYHKYRKLSYGTILLLIMVSGSLLVIFALHTLMNWLPGIPNNLGMLRYMVTIIPQSAVLAIYALNLFERVRTGWLLKWPFFLITIVLNIERPFKSHFFPFRASHEQIVISHTASFLRKLNYTGKKICYLHPYLACVVDIDPFDTAKTTLLWSLDTNHFASLPDSTLIVWDSHFSPQEGHLHLSTLLEYPFFHPVRRYEYFDDNAKFFTVVFIKLDRKSEKELPPARIVMDCGFLSDLPSDSFYVNFEGTHSNRLSTDFFLSPRHSIYFSEKDETALLFSCALDDNSLIAGVTVQFFVFPLERLKDVEVMIEALDTNQSQKTRCQIYQNLSDTLPPHKWNKIRFNRSLPLHRCRSANRLNIYILNNGKSKFYVDDLSVTSYYCVES